MYKIEDVIQKYHQFSFDLNDVKMLLELDNFKIVFTIVSLLVLTGLSSSITVDYNNCELVNLTTIYPLEINPKMRYYLFTSNNLTEGEEIEYDNITSLQTSKFNKEWPTRFFISGWKTTPQNCKTALIKDAYSKLGNYNFIIVNWNDWNKREYPLVVPIVNVVGRLLGNFTKFLNSVYGVSYSDMYLIGHSIGAHVAGAAGASISPDKYKTIYGLDPAGPGFVGMSTNYRLDPNDAEYVEIISTDIFYLGYGFRPALGHAVFYPNNGRRIQPSCPNSLTSNIRDQFCSHALAVNYFVNTLNKELEFCGVPTTYENVFLQRIPKDDGLCDVVMGGDPSIEKTGYYYVFVSKSEPLPA